MKNKGSLPRSKFVLAALFYLILPLQTNAQYIQQGDKLVGTGAVGGASQGSAVALSADGNTAIVGGGGDSGGAGAMWVWTRSGVAWTQQGSKLVGTGAVGLAHQGGISVSLSSDGNTAIVGAHSDNSFAGAAWVWTRSGGVWTQQGSKLVGTGAVGSDVNQGISVSLSADGNTALIGGQYDNNSEGGAAWVWTRSAGVWTQHGNKLVGTGAVNSNQGSSVTLSSDGNTALVGAYGDNGGAGAVWVWTRSGGVWTQQGGKLVGTGAVGGAGQGAVALSADGNTAIVGGWLDNNRTGAVWVWTRSGGVWTQQGGKLVGTGAVGVAAQGYSVALSSDGNTAFVSGPDDNSYVGAVWVWTRSNGVWSQQGNKLVNTGKDGCSTYQGMSGALSSDGNTAIVGGPCDHGNVGAAWVYTRYPLVPTLISPDNNAVNIPISANLTWAASSGSSSYRVQLSTDSLFSNLVVNDSTLTSNTKAVGPLANSTTYYWRVNAKNSAGTSTYSTIWKFTTVIAAPPVPILVSPSNNDTVYSASVNLTWNSASRATSYHVQVSTNSGFTTTVLNDSTVSTTTRSIPYTNDGVYYWRVNAKNVGGTSAYSPTWSIIKATVSISPSEFTSSRLTLSRNILYFSLPEKSLVKIRLYNTKGILAKTLLSDFRDKGSFEISLPNQFLKGGYFLDFQTDGFHKVLPIQGD